MAGMKPQDDRSYEMGMHTEQLAGRTQQAFFRPEEEERFLYPWAPEVDYNKRIEIDADSLTSTEVNAKLRASMNEGYGTIVVRNPRGKHSLGVGILNRLNLIFEGSLGYFAVGLIDGPNVRIHGRVGWSCGENMMAGTILIEKNAGSTFGAAMRGGDLVCRGPVGSRTGIDMKGGTIIVGGDTGAFSGFMMQRGRMVVCGNARGRISATRCTTERSTSAARFVTSESTQCRPSSPTSTRPGSRASSGSTSCSRPRASITSRRSSPASSSGTTTTSSRPRRS